MLVYGSEDLCPVGHPNSDLMSDKGSRKSTLEDAFTHGG